ncbi:DNA-binding PucR family transcriptional regulator [Streptacidiphilus sp. MAP12-33]|uniref:PucR family transcriptional regulator n=1 Tax=Streptacidiphilus sp. MAP12-33 TaxID=3156266 RepID=UPI003512616C
MPQPVGSQPLGGGEPDPEVAAHIRATAGHLLRHGGEILEAVGRQIAQETPESLDDPVMAEKIAASTRDNVGRWLHANELHPGRPVTTELTPENLDVARDLVRRGVDDRFLVWGYWRAQTLLWREWMAVALTAVPCPPGLLADSLDRSARSMTRFVERTLNAVQRRIDEERRQLVGGVPARRLETVTLLLEGAPIPEDRASARLGCDLRQRHLALVLWQPRGGAGQGDLEAAADRVAELLGARPPLAVPSGLSVLWAWIGVPETPDPPVLREALRQTLPDGAHRPFVAVGGPAPGAGGFRLGHQQALTTQRLVGRLARPPLLTAYEEVQVVALALQDEEQARQFVADTLGPLASAAPELAETLRVYLQAESHAGRTAELLYTHRNTVRGRVARAERLLPRPLAGRVPSVGLALELLRWLEPA